MRSKMLLLIEILVIATVFHLDYIGVLPASKVPFLFILGWISLRLRGLRWRDVGLRAPHWPITKILLAGVGVGVAMEALELFATQPFLTRVLGRGPDLEQLRPLIGNWKLLVLAVVLSWVLAAFGEETVYRGYLTNRAAEIFGSSKNAWIVAAILVTLLFGLAHFPQGVTGVVENVIDGAILAGIYFATGRNLIAPIIAHGIQDTVDVLLIYFGLYPGFEQSAVLPT